MAALCCHGLAWSAFVLLIFVPFYQGESITATPGGTNPTQPVESTATLIAVNGWGVVPIVLAPVAISGVGLLGLTLAVSGSLQRRITLGFSALLLLGFCIAGSFSIGMFYLPAALAMAVSAAIGFIQRKEKTVSS